MGVQFAIHAQLTHQLFRLDQVESHLIEPAFKPTEREFFLNLVFGVAASALGPVELGESVQAVGDVRMGWTERTCSRRSSARWPSDTASS